MRVVSERDSFTLSTDIEMKWLALLSLLTFAVWDHLQTGNTQGGGQVENNA